MKKNSFPTTYRLQLFLSPDGEKHLASIGRFYSIGRNDDYTFLLKTEHHEQKPTKQYRRERLYNLGFTKREADNIIFSNDEQWGLAERNLYSSIARWTSEITKAKERISASTSPRRQHDLTMYISKLSSKIRKAEVKGRSICFGGKKLQKRITQHPEDTQARALWDSKRLFLEFMGDKGRKYGNPVVHINCDELTVSLVLPVGMRRSGHLSEVIIGHVSPKRITSTIRQAIDNGSLYAKFVYTNKHRWELHVTVDEYEDKAGSQGNHERRVQGRTLGIDCNAGHVDLSVVSPECNVLDQMTLYFDEQVNGADCEVVQKVAKYADHWGVTLIGVEKLSGLASSRKSKKLSYKVLNKSITSMSYANIINGLERKATLLGIALKHVSPAYTSANTVQWGEARFGHDVHTRASYLIARRAMGVNIQRIKGINGKVDNSVCLPTSLGSVWNIHPHRETYHLRGSWSMDDLCHPQEES